MYCFHFSVCSSRCAFSFGFASSLLFLRQMLGGILLDLFEEKEDEQKKREEMKERDEKKRNRRNRVGAVVSTSR